MFLTDLKLPNYLARNGWTVTHAAWAIGLMVLGFLAGLPGWAEIGQIAARDEEASHVFLVPVVFVWLFWVRRGRLRSCRPERSFFGPVVVALGVISSIIGTRYGYYALLHGGSVMIVMGCFLTVAGKDIFFKFFPAFAVLIFLVPMPSTIRQNISIPMQQVVAGITKFVFDLMEVEVSQAGNVLKINGQDVAVAEACNGMRMVFTLIMVSFVIAFGTPLRGFVRFVILAGALPTAIICNLIRMVPTVWVFGITDPESLIYKTLMWIHGVAVSLGMPPYDTSPAAYMFHDIAGWVMIFVAFFLLMGIIRVMRWAMLPIRHYNLAYD